MLLVRTKPGQSSIEGIGLFADEFIPKGTIIWQFAPGLDLELTKAQVESLPSLAREFWYRYGYFNVVKQKFVLVFDHDRFINHSDQPNVGVGEDTVHGEGPEYALRDIKPGEELTCNYTDFDAEHAVKLVSADQTA